MPQSLQSQSPYRTCLAPFEPACTEPAPASGDRDMVVGLTLFWLVSLARVVGALVRREVFGTEATLATLAALLVPWVLLVAVRGRRPGP